MRSGSGPRRHFLAREPSRSVRRAIATPLPIVLALILLPPIALASPPDPSWIAGFYDGADGDDVVSLVCETSAANAAVPLHIGPLPCLPGISLEGIVRSIPGRHFTGGPRAPPVLRSSDFASVFNSPPPPISATEALDTLPPITAFRLFLVLGPPCDPHLHRASNRYSLPRTAWPDARDRANTTTGGDNHGHYRGDNEQVSFNRPNPCWQDGSSPVSCAHRGWRALAPDAGPGDGGHPGSREYFRDRIVQHPAACASRCQHLRNVCANGTGWLLAVHGVRVPRTVSIW